MNTHLMYMTSLFPQFLVPDKSIREKMSSLALYTVVAMTEAVMVATMAATPTRGRHLYASRYRGLMRKNIMSLLWHKERK
jgi:threonine/homoserine/homoserine lactone efflux protein